MTDLKIWYPQQYNPSKFDDLEHYKSKCQLDLYVLRDILSKNMPISLMKHADSTINTSNLIHKTDNDDIETLSIANSFISNLRCSFSDNMSRSFYYVPKYVRCSHTSDSLDYVVRLLEFGFDNIAPICWIRHSYLKFSDYVNGGEVG